MKRTVLYDNGTINASSKSNENNEKIAIIVYEYGLGNSPSLINLAGLLSKSKYSVDFFICNTYVGMLTFDDPTIHIHDLSLIEKDLPGFFSSAIKQILRRIQCSHSASFLVRCAAMYLRYRISIYADFIAATVGDTHYKCLIGAEPPGLMAAALLGKKLHTPYIYYNLELHSSSDIDEGMEWTVKNIEEEFQQEAIFTITQDDARAGILAQENSVALDKIVTIPVCADGEPFKEKTNILRERLRIGADRIIVLYAGFIAEWALCEEIAKSAQSWPAKFVLVFHSHGFDDLSYQMKLKKYEGTMVYFSDDPVTYEALPEFLASADIGIALYRGSKGNNFKLISSASGKIAHYLKSGLPIIVNNYPEISTIVESYSCGIAIDRMESIADAIQTICDRYAGMREGSYRCYEEHYRLSRHFSKLLDRLQRI